MEFEIGFVTFVTFVVIIITLYDIWLSSYNASKWQKKYARAVGVVVRQGIDITQSHRRLVA